MSYDTPNRARTIVKLAAKLAHNREVKHWLQNDERGVHEAAARNYLERTKNRAREMNLPESEVNMQIALVLALDAMIAILNSAKKASEQ